MKRKIYLKMKTLAEARELFLQKFFSLCTGEEEIDCREAAGRITAHPVSARFSSPSFHGAAMDGLAVHAQDTFHASDDSPVTLDIAGGQAVPINTGHPLPRDKDAVIMIENVLMSADQGQGVIRAPVYPWQHVRKAGEDIVATELLFPTNHRIAPADLGALLTAGCPTVRVRKRPRLTIIPTGSELVNLERDDQEVPPGKTVESNSAVLAALGRQAGAEVTVSPLVADDYENIKKYLVQAVDSPTDLVVINAGSSAGSADYTVQIIEELGEVLVHGVTIMPGKPTILGAIKGKPVVGNPGYPVSAIISFEQFVLPLLAAMQGTEPEEPMQLTAQLAKDLPSRAGMEEFRRMITGRIDDHFVTVPLKKGAGAITTLTRANSILRIPAGSEGLARNTEVQVELLRPRGQIEKTILCIGSHDLTLELLHDFLKKSNPSFPLCSTHVGSLGGILAIREGMAHIAGSHLLDPESGEYNTSYLKRYLKDQKVTLITLVYRQQGFMVRPGNPKKILDVHDLVRKDVTFINRQAGSGTRVLLDYELAKAGLAADSIAGYDYEEYTHMAVAVSVLSGKADAGLGILAAARALKLDFVPVTEERYDLVIPSRFLDLPMIRQLLHIINRDDFKKAAEAMGGYSTRETGQVRV
ncbi:MAG: molybdopterin biosynthesis protein [Deltaproteobacteria bacterium]|nr:molybdopterin biosynthesis protein [Deltaproteobacteria bacterium]